MNQDDHITSFYIWWSYVGEHVNPKYDVPTLLTVTVETDLPFGNLAFAHRFSGTDMQGVRYTLNQFKVHMLTDALNGCIPALQALEGLEKDVHEDVLSSFVSEMNYQIQELIKNDKELNDDNNN